MSASFSAAVAALLASVAQGVDRTLWPVPLITMFGPGPGGNTGQEFMDYSITYKHLTGTMQLTPADMERTIAEAIASDVVADRAVGCMVGNCIGDAVGAPLEFLSTTSEPISTVDERRQRRSPMLHPGQVDPRSGNLVYIGEMNRFELMRGQWTDDFSMALCLADSMIVNGAYEGGDTRMRYFRWWYQGYNNAFRFDVPATKKYRRSVGLGGNISKSIDDLGRYAEKAGTAIPARFESTGEDAGNGSIMRISPVPVRYHHDSNEAQRVGAESSYATHPGPDAAACSRFVTFLSVAAMNRPSAAGDEGVITTFLDGSIKQFLAATDAEAASDVSIRKLHALLASRPPSAKEAVWNWRAPRLALEDTIAARGRSYNGHPVTAGYFGSYCMDGLAMALWSLYHGRSFADTILRVTNLLGDCDTTGAIAGIMAGAFYGYSGIRHSVVTSATVAEAGAPPAGAAAAATAAATGTAAHESAAGPIDFGALWLRNMRRWDPMHEIELRALLLYVDGKKDQAAAAAASESEEA